MKRRHPLFLRIRQFVDHVDELGNASRPAVRQDQRSGIRALGPAVQEMHAQTVDDRAVLADLVEAGFEGPPVISGAPVVHEVFENGKRNALIPASRIGRGANNRLALGQPRRRQSRTQIVEIRIGRVSFEDVHISG